MKEIAILGFESIRKFIYNLNRSVMYKHLVWMIRTLRKREAKLTRSIKAHNATVVYFNNHIDLGSWYCFEKMKEAKEAERQRDHLKVELEELRKNLRELEKKINLTYWAV